MSNQLILWSMFVVPWLTLLLMKKEDVKRLMPVGLLSALTSVIIHETGLTFNWWIALETAYPLQLMPYLIGLNPVLTMWVLKFTFRKFWWYLAVEIVLNAGFNIIFLGWLLSTLGILKTNQNPFIGICLTTSHGMALYAYQLWQDGALIHTGKEKKSE